MLKKFCELFRKKYSEKGQGIVEYVILLGVVAVIAVGLIDGSKLQNSIKIVVEYMKAILGSSRL